METMQLPLFPEVEKRKIGSNPYRDIDGKYCSKEQSDMAKIAKENIRLNERISYLENKVEMYERAYIALSKRLKETLIDNANSKSMQKSGL